MLHQLSIIVDEMSEMPDEKPIYTCQKRIIFRENHRQYLLLTFEILSFLRLNSKKKKKPLDRVLNTIF